jgi:hypothetical protein
MDAIGTFYFSERAGEIQSQAMDNGPRLTGGVDRVIHVPLSEADWQAFIAATPQPVNWLKERIREAIVKNQHPVPTNRDS